MKPLDGYQKTRWSLFHMLYFFIFWYGWVVSIFFYHQFNIQYITDILSIFVALFLLLLFFERSRIFSFKYLLIPLHGFVWIVFFFRLVFDLVGGIDWLSHFTMLNFPDIGLQQAKLADVLYHFLPLLIVYQVIYGFKDEIVREVESLRRPVRMMLAYAPALFIAVWSVFVNPFETYAIPTFSYCHLYLYAAVFLVISVTAFIHQEIYLHRAQRIRLQNILEVSALVTLFFNALLGIFLFGIANLTDSILQWSASLAVLLLLLRRFHRFKKRWTSILLLPIFGFALLVAILRETALVLGMNCHDNFLGLIPSSLPVSGDILYALYLFIHYVCVVQIMADILIEELPLNLSTPSKVRSILIEQRLYLGKWDFLHTIYHGYGAVILLALFGIVQSGYGRYEDLLARNMPLAWLFALAVLVATFFPYSLYRMQVIYALHRREREDEGSR